MKKKVEFEPSKGPSTWNNETHPGGFLSDCPTSPSKIYTDFSLKHFFSSLNFKK